MWQFRKEVDAAMRLQRIFRRQKERRQNERNALEYQCVLIIQTCWRKRYEDICVHSFEVDLILTFLLSIRTRMKWFRSVKGAVLAIQTFERMRVHNTYYNNFLRERLWWYRASRELSSHVQRLWRGFCGRSRARKGAEMAVLPDPSSALNFELWIQHQKEAHPPRRAWKMWAEYILSGYPRTWHERSIKRHDIYYRNVKFWVNVVTRKSSWVQPGEWVILDRNAFENRQQVFRLGFTLEQSSSAGRLQALWRAKRARRYLGFILHAKRIMDKAVIAYSHDPDNITALVNYTLYVHVILVSPLIQFTNYFILKSSSYMTT